MPLQRIYFQLAGAAILWGGTFVAGRVVAAEVMPFSAAFVRFALASAVLGVLAGTRPGGFPPARLRPWLAVSLLGLTGVFAYNALFFTGLRTVPASRAALIIANNPVCIALGAALFLGERLRRLQILGAGVALAGALTVISHGNLVALWHGGVAGGEWAILGCVVVWTIYTLVGRRVLGSLSPLAAVTGAALVGTLLLLGPALREGVFAHLSGWSARTWVALLYLAGGGTVVAFVWYYRGVRALGAARAGVFINLVPVSGVALACALLGERPDASLAVGGVLVGVGLVLTQQRSRGRAAPNLDQPARSPN